MVTEILKTREVAASIDQTWDAISDLRNERRYWPVIKDIKIHRRSVNTIEREATIMSGPLGNVKSVQTILMDPKKSLTLKMTQGPLVGTRKIILTSLDANRTRVDITWEFDLVNIPRFAESFVKDRITEVTENALQQMALGAERQSRQASP